MRGSERCIVAILASLLLTCSVLAPAGTADEPWKQSGTLRVLYPPFDLFFSDRPERPGFDREILEGFAKLHRLTLEPIAIDSWEHLIPALMSGRGDMIAGGYTNTPERAKSIAFTAEVFTTYNVVLTRKPNRVVRFREDLRKQIFGVLRGTTFEQSILREGVPTSQFRYMRPEEIRPALREGTITAVVYGLEDAIPDQRKDPDLQIGMAVGPPESLAFGVRNDDVELLAALNSYITAFRKTPSWNRLVVKYMGDSTLDILQRARAHAKTIQ